ncbi:MAG: DUF2127 domain-containing protein [Paracoccaceae bacterium]|nr:DUF2127 domain-containing protein [Paracoccaceae bacterium]
MRRLGPGELNSLLHRTFETSLVLKGLFALSELCLGLGLYLIGSDAIVAAVHALTAHEISQDPTDPVARFLLAQVGGLTRNVQHFYAFYLASHGALKLAMIALLLRGVLWAYPLSIVVLIGFVVYQLSLMSAGPSLGLVLLTLLDVAVIALTIHEYRRLRHGY